MTTFAQRAAPAAQLAWPAMAASLLLVAMGTGFIAPIVPIIAAMGAVFLAAAPMRTTAGFLLTLGLVADNPGERPMDGLWRSPLAAPGELLYLNLHKVTGIAALRFSALELIAGTLMLVLVIRKMTGDPIDDPQNLGAVPNPMKRAFLLLFGATLFTEFYGIARHGDFANSLWQMRQIFWLPVLGVLFGHAFKTEKARVMLLRIVVAAATIRALMGIYFYFTVMRRVGEAAAYATTHSDSMLAVTAILVLMMALVVRRSRDNIILNILVQPVLLMGMIANNRRLAFVGLLAGIACALALAPPSVKRAMRRAFVASIPAIIIYAAIGWNSHSAVFKPVSIIRSVSSQKDNSSKTRDIENYNLIMTLKRHPILGSGFGHEYIEQVQANRVDLVFAQYKFIGHNSVLWLLSVAGWAGFTAMWFVFPVAMMIALRALKRSTTPIDQITAFGTIAAVLCFVLQAWGDMGLQSWMGTLLVSAFTGAAGALLTSHQTPLDLKNAV